MASVPTGLEPKQEILFLESTRTLTPALRSRARSADPEVAARAELALGRTKNSGALAALIPGTRSNSVAVRAMAVYAIGLLADQTRIEPAVIIRALGDPASAVRVTATDAAGRLIAAGGAGLAPLIARLERNLTDVEPAVRGRAAVALTAVQGEAVISAAGAAVAAALPAERVPDVRRHLAWSLRRAFSASVTSAAIAAGLADPDDEVRMQFLSIVATRKMPAAQVEALLNDPSWRVAEQAREAVRTLAGLERTAHLTAIPDGVVTPDPAPSDSTVARPRPRGSFVPHRPSVDDARLDVPFTPDSVASLSGAMPGPHPRVRIGTTQGPIVVRLLPEWAPLTVANFLTLADHGAYDKKRWFRIVPNFVAQTGALTDDPEEKAAYTIPAEENPVEQRTGVISMGLEYSDGPHPAALRDSANSQFYITISPQLHLNRAFTVFGYVESGFATLGRLTESDRMTRVEQLPDD